MKSPTAMVRKVIARVAMVPESEVVDSATISELGISSFDRIECVLSLEEAFQIELPQAVLENARTVADLNLAIHEALQRKPALQLS